ncbi:NAD-dependent epimerase/dehydratase family protein [Bacteroidota bacterium]
MTIAITGTTGHLAASIISLLNIKAYRIRALQYKQELPLNLKSLETIKGSLSDINTLNQLVNGCDIVIHCAAKISINSNKDASVYDTNVNGTVNIFNAAKRANVKRFIHISSIHAYNQYPNDEILDETRPYCSDKSPQYDQSKRDAEQFVLQQSSGPMEVLVLNPTAVVGPNDYKPSLMGKAIMDIYNRKVPSLIKGGFDFCDVRDVAHGIVNAIDKGRTGHSYLLAGKWYSLSNLEQIIMGIKGDTRSLPVLPAWMGHLGLPFINMIASFNNKEPLYTKESLHTLITGNKKTSSTKAAQELDYICRPLQETISDTIYWFKKVKYLQ